MGVRMPAVMYALPDERIHRQAGALPRMLPDVAAFTPAILTAGRAHREDELIVTEALLRLALKLDRFACVSVQHDRALMAIFGLVQDEDEDAFAELRHHPH